VATVADAADIAELHAAGWEAAYRGIMPDEVLDGIDVDEWRARRHDALAEGRRMLVFEADDCVVLGFAALGPCRDADRAGAGEVYALYVRPGHWRAGVGRALLAAAVEDLRASGFTRPVLWALRNNIGARAFYESQGWVADGSSKVSPTGPVDVRYELPESV
jgi:GNAT superfamily N-acetyltransferase